MCEYSSNIGVAERLAMDSILRDMNHYGVSPWFETIEFDVQPPCFSAKMWGYYNGVCHCFYAMADLGFCSFRGRYNG